MEIGTVCTKITGRESGRTAVVVDVVDKNFVIVAGPKVKRRRCNIDHLDPSEVVVDIKKEATDKQIVSALKKAKVDT